jgi:hypothetical protein
MNGKQAKRLRRAALGLAATLTEAGKDIKKDGYQVLKRENKLSASSVFVDRLMGVPSVDDPFDPPSYRVVVRPDSVKGIYKTLKGGKA